MIAIEEVGARIYVTGNSFEFKTQLKAEGCHWDADRRQWWIGKAKKSAIESIVAKSQQAATPTAPQSPADTASIRVLGKAKYKGKSYYVRWVGTCKTGAYKAHLITLDGSIDFWANCAQPHEYNQFDGNGDVAKIEKTYDPREYRGQIEYTTLGSIRRYIESMKKEKSDPTVDRCAECGKAGHLHEDLEDGMMKCYGCCDIPR